MHSKHILKETTNYVSELSSGTSNIINKNLCLLIDTSKQVDVYNRIGVDLSIQQFPVHMPRVIRPIGKMLKVLTRRIRQYGTWALKTRLKSSNTSG